MSASGSTYFIEPMGAVKANNELRELQSKEEAEIERILADPVRASAASFREDIAQDYDLLLALDLIFARGKLSYQMNGMEPEIGGGRRVSCSARPGTRCWTRRRRCPSTWNWGRASTPWLSPAPTPAARRSP